MRYYDGRGKVQATRTNCGGEEVNLLYSEDPDGLPPRGLWSGLFPEIHPLFPGLLTPSIAHEDICSLPRWALTSMSKTESCSGPKLQT